MRIASMTRETACMIAIRSRRRKEKAPNKTTAVDLLRGCGARTFGLSACLGVCAIGLGR